MLILTHITCTHTQFTRVCARTDASVPLSWERTATVFLAPFPKDRHGLNLLNSYFVWEKERKTGKKNGEKPEKERKKVHAVDVQFTPEQHRSHCT